MAPRLASTGQSARLIVLDTGRDVDLPKIELVEASYRDFASMRQALAGVHTFFMIPVHEAPDRVQQHVTAVDAAVAASVKRIVYSSFVGASPDATFTFARDHWHTEEHIRSTDLDFTFLRGNVYLDVLPWFSWAPTALFVGPQGMATSLQWHATTWRTRRSRCCWERTHSGVTYDVSGPERLTLHQVAEHFSRAVGRDITYHAETIEEAYEARASYGAPDWEVEGWVTSLVGVARGEMDVVSATVGELTGHPPMGLAEFLRRYPESYRHLVRT